MLAVYAECRVSGTSAYDLVTCNGQWVNPENEKNGQTKSVKSANLNKLTPGIITGLVLLLAVYKPSQAR